MYAYHIVQCTSVWYLNVFRIQLPVTVHYGTFGIVPSRWLHAMLILVWHVINCFALDLDLLRWLWGMHLQVCVAPRIHRVTGLFGQFGNVNSRKSKNIFSTNIIRNHIHAALPLWCDIWANLHTCFTQCVSDSDKLPAFTAAMQIE